MKRVAVITDIHGNLSALEASLDAIDAIGVDGLFCGGDLVGYGPHPNEVCRLIEDRAIPTIYGNYDYAIARELDDCGCAYVTQHDRELGQQSVAWTLEHTDQLGHVGTWAPRAAWPPSRTCPGSSRDEYPHDHQPAGELLLQVRRIRKRKPMDHGPEATKHNRVDVGGHGEYWPAATGPRLPPTPPPTRVREFAGEFVADCFAAPD